MMLNHIQESVWNKNIKDNIETALTLLPQYVLKSKELIVEVTEKLSNTTNKIYFSRREREFVQDVLDLDKVNDAFLNILNTYDENIKSKNQTEISKFKEEIISGWIDFCEIRAKLINSEKFKHCFGYSPDSKIFNSDLTWSIIGGN
jgi:hypothetical protein